MKKCKTTSLAFALETFVYNIFHICVTHKVKKMWKSSECINERYIRKISTGIVCNNKVFLVDDGAATIRKSNKHLYIWRHTLVHIQQKHIGTHKRLICVLHANIFGSLDAAKVKFFFCASRIVLRNCEYNFWSCWQPPKNYTCTFRHIRVLYVPNEHFQNRITLVNGMLYMLYIKSYITYVVWNMKKAIYYV